MNQHPILIVSGTNRPGSHALQMSRALERHYRAADVPAAVYSLAELPPELFDPASYASKPAPFLAVQQRVLDAPGLHVVTPEYNGSFPGVLKYFIDMLKFPESFERKPVAFVGEAAGVWGGLRAVEQLQQIFGYRNAHIYPERVFVPGVAARFDANGTLTDASIDERLARQARGFAEFAGLLCRARG
jgi:NAD(P)H-dependent FMN reductase